jgi:hypothetical protein
MWFVIWALLALMITMAGGFAAFAGALALAPFVLLLADNAVTFSINDLIDYDGSSGSLTLVRILTRNLTAAVVIAVIGLLLSFALSGALGGENVLTAACIPTVIAAIVVLAVSVFVTIYGRRRLDKDKELSNATTTLLVMLVGLAVQMALTFAVLQL